LPSQESNLPAQRYIRQGKPTKKAADIVADGSDVRTHVAVGIDNPFSACQLCARLATIEWERHWAVAAPLTFWGCSINTASATEDLEGNLVIKHR
jgi:hypothetical protein